MSSKKYIIIIGEEYWFDVKREYVWKNIEHIQFRTITTETRNEALEIERFLKHQNIHIFNT